MQATFKLTPAQMRKMKSSKPFQLSHAQLIGEGVHSKHDCDIHMSLADSKKCESAIRRKKGFRFTPNNIVGGKINLKKIIADPLTKAIANKVVKVATKAMVKDGTITQNEANSANSIASKAISGNVNGAKAEATNALNGGMFKIKDGRIRGNFDAKNSMKGLKLGLDISKKVVVQPNVLGAVATGNAPLFVAALGANAVNLALKEKGVKAKISDKQALSVVNAISKTVDATNNPAVLGQGVKPAKGSQAMKDKMKALRDRRKGVSGGSFRSLNGDGVKGGAYVGPSGSFLPMG